MPNAAFLKSSTRLSPYAFILLSAVCGKTSKQRLLIFVYTRKDVRFSDSTACLDCPSSTHILPETFMKVTQWHEFDIAAPAA